jgi:hypothetical protein
MGWYEIAKVVHFMGLIALFGFFVVYARAGERLRAALGEGEGPVSPAIARTILDPARWGTVGALNGASLGVLFVMTTKVGWTAAIAIVVLVAALVGGIFTSLVRRKRDGLSSGRAKVPA